MKSTILLVLALTLASSTLSNLTPKEFCILTVQETDIFLNKAISSRFSRADLKTAASKAIEAVKICANPKVAAGSSALCSSAIQKFTSVVNSEAEILNGLPSKDDAAKVVFAIRAAAGTLVFECRK